MIGRYDSLSMQAGSGWRSGECQGMNAIAAGGVPVVDLKDLFNAAEWPRLFYLLFRKLLAEFILGNNFDPQLLGLVELAAR